MVPFESPSGKVSAVAAGVVSPSSRPATSRLRRKPATPVEPTAAVAPPMRKRSSAQRCCAEVPLLGAGIWVWPFSPLRHSWRCSYRSPVSGAGRFW